MQRQKLYKIFIPAIVLLLFFLPKLNAQQNKLQSANVNYLHSDKINEALSLIKKIESNFANDNYKDDIENINKVVEIGNIVNDKKIIGTGLMLKAQYYMYDSKPIEAEKLFDKSLTLLPQNDKTSALCWNDRGYNAGLIGDLQNQAKYYLNALRIYENLNNQSGAALTYSNLSTLYFDLAQKDKAIFYAKKAIEARENLKDIKGLCNSYCNLSQIYLDVDINEADKYAQLCNKMAEQLDNYGKKIQAINTLGLVKDRQGKKGEIINSALEVVKILEKNENPSSGLSRQYLAVGIIMSETRMDSATALSYFNKGLDMALALGDKTTIRDAYYNITAFYKIRSDFFNAYENIKKYHRYKDSIITNTTQSNVAELQTKYETDKKDNELNRLYAEQKIKELKIAQLNTEQQIKQLAIEKQNAIIAGNVALAMQKQDELDLLLQKKVLQDLELKQKAEALDKQLLLAQSQKQQLDIAEKEKQLDAAALKNQKQLRNIIIAFSLFSLALAGILFNRYQLKKKIKEQQNLLSVRYNIAKDLHDDIGSTLSSIKILSEVSYKNIDKDNAKAADILKKIIEQSEHMQQGISDIVWSVKPDNDKLENITIKMREYVAELLESKNIETTFDIDNTLLLNQIGMQQRKDLLLIFKEAINNAAKYSNAKKVKIELNKLSKNIKLTIYDDGIGFDLINTTLGNGLKNMKSRAERLNGSFIITSNVKKGTLIKVEIPLA